MSNFVACPKLSVLTEHYKKVVETCGRHMRPNSRRRREAEFSIRVALKLFEVHRLWCVRCRTRAN
jgi:hypothetical protein